MHSLHDDLTQHADFVSRLARSLSRPGDDPEAAAQEAMTAAIQRPPGSIDEPRSWLAKVVGRSLTRSRRGDARRAERETLAARPPQGGPSTVDQLAEIELGKRLLSHVRDLDPIYRDVLFQRYYEHLKPAQIAEASGQSLATIKTRLARALREMRARLDAEDPGGRNAWLGAAVALGGGTVSVHAGAAGAAKAAAGTGWAESSGALVGVVATAGALVALGVFGLRDSPDSDPAVVQATPERLSEPKLVATALGPMRESIETAMEAPGKSLSPTAAPAVRQGDPISAELPVGTSSVARTIEPRPWTGFVRDFQGRPLAGAVVRAEDKDGDVSRPLEATTDSLGYFHLGPARGITKARVEYLDWVPLTRPRPTRDLTGSFKSATFLMAPKGKLELRVTYADGSPVRGMDYAVRINPYGANVGDAWLSDQGNVVGKSTGEPISMDVPSGVPLTVSVPGGEIDRWANGTGLTFQDSPDGPPILAGAEGTASVDVVIATDVEVRVNVLGPDGEPCPEAKVQYRGRRDSTEMFGGPAALPSEPENERARRVISVRTEEPLTVQASLRDKTEAWQILTAEAHLTLSGRSAREVTLQLRPSSLHGVVHGPEGPVHRAIVEFRNLADPEAQPKRVPTDKDGSFRIRSLSPGSHAVSVESREYERTEFGAVRPGMEPLTLTLTEPLAAHVEFLLLMEGRELTRSEVWWTVAEEDLEASAVARAMTADAFQLAVGVTPYESDGNGRMRTRQTYRSARGAVVNGSIAPGLYRFHVRGEYWEEFNGGSRGITTDAMASDWVEVQPGNHSVELVLPKGRTARWVGRIAPSRPSGVLDLTAFHRIGVAICSEDGDRIPVDSEGISSTTFVYSGWQGRIWVDKIPPGAHEVWIGTEAQIDAGHPLARHLVEFPEGTTELTLTY
ncbi:RNA polymerase sigma factor SigV [Planctomycetes bacterium Poly30]|uniref:RNA polymerase sigma factor SigV n=1 Tax=Saltatorellus ferox TaxID=2528018 RepID=A0A518EZG8_9BACT|nr:RNA polymerase sigma factor SigV [Planctomycetes bacterium Poly30]